MRYLTLCGRLSRDVFVNVPGDEPFAADRLVSIGEPERWSGPDEPTIYLAGDVGVALAELGRHTPGLPGSGEPEQRRRLIRVRVDLDRVLDLTRVETLDALRIDGAPWAFTDPERARAIARQVRASGDCEGMLVPSVAFLDQPERWNVVIFAERLEGPIESAVTEPTEVGTVRLGGARPVRT